MLRNGILCVFLLCGAALSSPLNQTLTTTIPTTIPVSPQPTFVAVADTPKSTLIQIDCDTRHKRCADDKQILSECGFKDLQQLVIIARTRELNASLIVERCPAVCQLTYGSGNPDISGIGLMISYLIQLVTTIIFGPLYLAAYRLSHRSDEISASDDDKQNPRKASTSRMGFVADVVRLIDSLREIQNTVTDTNAAFTIAVGAAIVHQSFAEHSSPLYDRYVLKRLVSTQLSLTLCSITSQIGTGWTRTSLAQRKDTRQPSKNPMANVQKGLMLMLYWLTASVLTIIALSETIAPLEFRQIVGSCPKDTAPKFESDRPYDYYKGGDIDIHLWVLGFICLLEIPAYFFYYLFSKTHRFVAVSFFIMSTFYLSVAIVLTVDNWKSRVALLDSCKSPLDINAWGFGQVTALVLWLPLCIQTLLKIESMSPKQTAR